MIGALKKSSVNGAVPLISLFIERNGYNIVSIKILELIVMVPASRQIV